MFCIETAGASFGHVAAATVGRSDRVATRSFWHGLPFEVEKEIEIERERGKNNQLGHILSYTVDYC